MSPSVDDRRSGTHTGVGARVGSKGENMARGINLLSARTVAATQEEGKHSDGGGLYLHVRKRSQAIERVWVFRYKRGPRGATKERTLGLGPARDVSLAEAREIADRCRRAVASGRDPRLELVRTNAVRTFGEVADDLVEAIVDGFKNPKHVAQWKMTLGDTYCRQLRRVPINKITTEDVLQILKPIWVTKPETASRLRGRIERVLDAATVRHLRSGDNPARWKGHLKHLLPMQPELVRGHHKALPWSDMPAFMQRLRAFDSVSARALEWTILTVARTGMTTGGARAEIDRSKKTWTVPGPRMKMGEEHRVPLPQRCLDILDEMAELGSDWLFPGQDLREHISDAAMAECLKGLSVEATVHGFRSSFRDWAGDATSFPRELAEAALAHKVGDNTENAYRRSDALERRRKLMDAWERYCSGSTMDVAAIHSEVSA